MSKKYMLLVVGALCLANLGCASSAFAEDPVPPPPMPAVQQEKPTYEIPHDTLVAIETYMNQSIVLYSVKCGENMNNWYCNASPIMEAMKKTIKVKEKPADKPSKEKK